MINHNLAKVLAVIITIILAFICIGLGKIFEFLGIDITLIIGIVTYILGFIIVAFIIRRIIKRNKAIRLQRAQENINRSLQQIQNGTFNQNQCELDRAVRMSREQTKSIIGTLKVLYLIFAFSISVPALTVISVNGENLLKIRGDFKEVKATVIDFEWKQVRRSEGEEDNETYYTETMYTYLYKLESGKEVWDIDDYSKDCRPERYEEVTIMYNAKTNIASNIANYEVFMRVRPFLIFGLIAITVIDIPAIIMLIGALIRMFRGSR